ncbi:MAG: IscS subfamily cysteine desulfurase [Rhodothermales bacterium]
MGRTDLPLVALSSIFFIAGALYVGSPGLASRTSMIYLDYNATTPVAEAVLERMLPYFTQHFGNASSSGHAFGWAADEAVSMAREQVAEALGTTPETIVFTSGATEGANCAIKGIAEAYSRRGRHLITAVNEHKAVLDAHKALQRQGFQITTLPVDADGRVSVDDLEAALTDETTLVSVMWANNEVGTIQPIAELADAAHARGALFMTDATQAVGKVPVSVADSGVDVLVCSGHKVYGPKGVGALYLRRSGRPVRMAPLLNGGGQEQGQRGGTLNVPGIVGMGAALALAIRLLTDEAHRQADLRDAFEARLRKAVPGLRINGGGAPRLPNTANVCFPDGVDGGLLMAWMRDVAVSAGSACASGSGQASHALTAMGLSAEEAGRSVRFSLGRRTTAADMDAAFASVLHTLERLNVVSPVS